MQQPAAQLPGGLIKELGLIPHDQPGGPLVANLAAFWQQISPIVPVLPTVPAHKCCAVYNLAFEAFHGMEEVIGSIPIRSTNKLIIISESTTYTLAVSAHVGCHLVSDSLDSYSSARAQAFQSSILTGSRCPLTFERPPQRRV